MKVIQDKTLTDIANAIREKSGTANKMTPAEMPEKIKDIKSGSDLSIPQLFSYPDEVSEPFDLTDTSLKSVRWYGFANTRLRKGTFPNLVKLDEGAFRQCSDLVEIDAPIETFGKTAFQKCSALTTIDLSHAKGSIGESVFNGCTKLNPLNFLGEGVTGIEAYAFSYGLNCKSIKLPRSCTRLQGSQQFFRCKIKYVFVPKELEGASINSFSQIGTYDHDAGVYNCNFYTDAENEPSGWNRCLSASGGTTHFGVSEEEFDAIVEADES